MKNDSISESLTYVGDKPDIKSLRYSYDQSTNELESYFDLCRNSYDDRRNWWPGKSRDLRKHGADAFPWDGASDMEAHTIDERITRLVSLFISALNRSNIRAFPVEVGDIPRSKVVTNFLKWMITSGYIPRFQKEMELGANYLLERGILLTYVGWHREDRTFLQRLSLEQIAAINPEIGEKIATGEPDETIINLLQASFNGVTSKRAKKALKDLSKFGFAELPIVRRQVNCPEVKTAASTLLFLAHLLHPTGITEQDYYR